MAKKVQYSEVIVLKQLIAEKKESRKVIKRSIRMGRKMGWSKSDINSMIALRDESTKVIRKYKAQLKAKGKKG